MKAFKIATLNGYSIVDLDKLVILEMQADKGVLNFENGTWVQCSLAEAKTIERGFDGIQEAYLWRIRCINRIWIRIMQQSFELTCNDLIYRKPSGCFFIDRRGVTHSIPEEEAERLLQELKSKPEFFRIEDYRNEPT